MRPHTACDDFRPFSRDGLIGTMSAGTVPGDPSFRGVQMRFARSAVTLSTVAVMALVAAMAVPAIGETRTFHDRRGDVSASVDIRGVKVVNGAPGDRRIKVTVYQRHLLGGDEIDIWVDTRSAHPGPEYRVGAKANTDALGVLRVRSWGGRGHLIRCSQLDVRSDQFASGDRSRFLIPRRCLGSPGAIRISVRVQRDTSSGSVRDWAPRRHVFFGRVGATLG